MIVGTYLEDMIKKRRARQMAEAVERGRAEGVAKGRSEGVAETSAKWRAWNDRRLDAESKGDPFDEPPPGLDG